MTCSVDEEGVSFVLSQGLLEFLSVEFTTGTDAQALVIRMIRVVIFKNALDTKAT